MSTQPPITINTLLAIGVTVIGLGALFTMFSAAPWALKQEVSELRHRIERMDVKLDALMYEQLATPYRRVPKKQ